MSRVPDRAHLIVVATDGGALMRQTDSGTELADPASLALSDELRRRLHLWSAQAASGPGEWDAEEQARWQSAGAQLASDVSGELGPVVTVEYRAAWTTYAPAYSSTLSLSFGGITEPTPAEPAPMVTDKTDTELAELRRRIVDPVVRALLTDDELGDVTVYLAADGDIWLQLTAVGEECRFWLAEDADLAGVEPSQIAEQLASTLEDFIAESTFAWGQQRIAHYQLPSPR